MQVAMWDSLDDSGAASQLQLVTAKGKLAEMIGARNEARKALRQAEANLKGLRSGITFENNSKIAQLAGEEAVVAENIKKIKDDISHKARTYYIEKQGSQWRLKQVFNPERLEYAQQSTALSTDGI